MFRQNKMREKERKVWQTIAHDMFWCVAKLLWCQEDLYSFPSSVQSMYINIIRGYYYGNFLITWQYLLKPWKRKKPKPNPEENQFLLGGDKLLGRCWITIIVSSHFDSKKKQTNKKQISQIVFMFFPDRISSSNLLKLIKNRFIDLRPSLKYFVFPQPTQERLTH